MIEPRPIREPLGESVEPAVRAGDSVEYKLELTRSGWSNPAGLPRSTLQRVAYRLQNRQALARLLERARSHVDRGADQRHAAQGARSELPLHGRPNGNGTISGRRSRLVSAEQERALGPSRSRSRSSSTTGARSSGWSRCPDDAAPSHARTGSGRRADHRGADRRARDDSRRPT